MAKIIKRTSVTVIVLITVGVLCILPLRHAQSTEGDAPPSPPDHATVEQAMTLRAVLGIGPNDLITAVSGDGHQQIIAKGIAFLTAHREQLIPLITNYQNTHNQLVELLSKGEPTDDVFAQLDSARESLLAAAQGLFDDVDSNIPPAYQTVITRLIENSGLDTDLRPLDLTTEQRAALLSATRQRDTVLLDARNWYQDDINESANAHYEAAVTAILTESQRSQRASFRQLMINRAESITTAELAMMDGT